jgi:hypothetical protein
MKSSANFYGNNDILHPMISLSTYINNHSINFLPKVSKLKGASEVIISKNMILTLLP